jgi:hypothetical protein
MVMLKLQSGVVLNLDAFYMAQEWEDGSITLLLPPTAGPSMIAEVPTEDAPAFWFAAGEAGLYGRFTGPPPRRPTDEEMEAAKKEQMTAAQKALIVPPNGSHVSSFDHARRRR